MILEGAPSSRGGIRGRGASEITDLAASLVLRLLRGLKKSLALSSGQAYIASELPASEPIGPDTSMASELNDDITVAKPLQHVPLLQGKDHSRASVAIPLLGTRLPLPLPKVPEGILRGAALAHFTDSVVNVTALAFSVAGKVRWMATR